MNTKSFCRVHKINIESEMVGENKNAPDWKDAYHYKVILRMGKKQMTTYFSMGYAHTDEPEVEDVLDCLASDASGVENARDFDDFCAEFGYDTDSRKAERIYNACKRGAFQLKKFLGDKLYNSILWDTERL